MLLPFKARPAALFADPAGEAAKRFFETPADAVARVETLAQLNWALACTGKFVWPIADRGLANRIHRIAAATLIVWGEVDSTIAPAYAESSRKKAQVAVA